MPDRNWWSVRAKVAPDALLDTGDGRSEFERDRARVLHSRAFRRLQAKTQVFPPSKKDFYRTRLTHSLECSQIGKALALRLWNSAVPEAGVDLVEAACLAHDIGHPPCGHLGEDVLRELVPFDANAQNLRILTLLEEKVLASGEDNLGLNLSRATLVSIMKYPYREAGRTREFLYDEEVARLPLPGLLDASPFRLLEDGEENYPRPFPLQLMEWADDVAYSTHDMEDGINAGFISSMHLLDEEYRHSITARVAKQLPRLSGSTLAEAVESLADKLARELTKWADPPAHRVKALLDKRIDRLVRAVERAQTNDGDDWLYGFNLVVADEIRVECEFLKAVVTECVFRDPRVTRLEFKQKKIIKDLFEALEQDCCSDKAPRLFPRSWWEDVDRAKNLGEREQKRLVADYLAGMSDTYCMQMYSVLYDPNYGSAFVTA